MDAWWRRSIILVTGLLLAVWLGACASPREPTLSSPPEEALPSFSPLTQIRPRDQAEMVFVPAGEIWLGSSEEDIDRAMRDCRGCPADWFAGEKPIHKVFIKAFWIDRFEVTNRQYALFLEDGGYNHRELWTAAGWDWKERMGQSQPKYWDEPRWNQPDHPVVGVGWFEALAFCAWAGARLPSEAEWERAAGWDPVTEEKYIFPWGNAWDPEKANTSESNLGATTPAGKYCPQGQSPSGVCDMAGNVWEWTNTIHRPYPYDLGDGREDVQADGTRVLRGGSWINGREWARVAYRLPPFPGDFIIFDPTNGFRCAQSEAQ